LDAIIDRVRHNLQVPDPDRPAQQDVAFCGRLSQSRVARTHRGVLSHTQVLGFKEYCVGITAAPLSRVQRPCLFPLVVTAAISPPRGATLERLSLAGVGNRLRQTFPGAPNLKTCEKYVLFLRTGDRVLYSSCVTGPI
jgi:hypothetical protein